MSELSAKEIMIDIRVRQDPRLEMVGATCSFFFISQTILSTVVRACVDKYPDSGQLGTYY